MDSSAGFLAELAASRGCGSSLTRQRWTVRRRQGAPTESIDIVLKTKPGARVMQGLLAEVAGFAKPELGRLFRRFPLLPGLARYQRREAAIQGCLPPPLARHLPRTWAAWSEPGGYGFTLANEYLGETDWTGRLVPWPDHRLERAIRVMAELHAPHLGATSAIARSNWLAPPVTTTEAIAARPLWLALADFTDTILGAGTGHLLRRLVDGLEDWWPLLDALPQTLVHNDLNPRNIVWQATPAGEQPRIFDWELARLGAPQADLVELLCFVLEPEANGETVLAWLDRHRQMLQALSGRGLDSDIWLLGARLALCRFGLERLPLYALAQHVRPAPFAPALAANWAHLLELTGLTTFCRAFAPLALFHALPRARPSPR
jgi:hydroxymethylglutaryl-CoA reductase (NADPH)